MKNEEALKILRMVAESVRVTKKDHDVIQDALRTLEEATKEEIVEKVK